MFAVNLNLISSFLVKNALAKVIVLNKINMLLKRLFCIQRFSARAREIERRGCHLHLYKHSCWKIGVKRVTPLSLPVLREDE